MIKEACTDSLKDVGNLEDNGVILYLRVPILTVQVNQKYCGRYSDILTEKFIEIFD